MNKPIANVDFVKFGQQVFKLRHRRRMTQKELGEKISVSDTTITNCELGRPLTAQNYYKLCDFLGIHESNQVQTSDTEIRRPSEKQAISPSCAPLTAELDTLVTKLQTMMTGRQALAKANPHFKEAYGDEIVTLRKTIGVVAMLRALA